VSWVVDDELGREAAPDGVDLLAQRIGQRDADLLAQLGLLRAPVLPRTGRRGIPERRMKPNPNSAAVPRGVLS
jgi:hypothetical protein